MNQFMNIDVSSSHLNQKKPKQQRSKSTVQTILKAAAETLANEGLENFNTNALAAKSGVSVGTIYQYFSSKEQIIHALIDRHMEDRAAKIRSVMSEKPGYETPHQSLCRFLRRVAEWHQIDPEYAVLNRALMHQLPRSYGSERFEQLDKKLAEIIKASIIRDGKKLEGRNVDVVVAVALKATRGTFQLLESQPIGSQQLEASIQEIATLLFRFID